MKFLNCVSITLAIGMAVTGCTTVGGGSRLTDFRTKVVAPGCVVLTNNKKPVKRTAKDKSRYAYGKGENCPAMLPRSDTKILKVESIRTQGGSAVVVYKGKSGTQNILFGRNTDPDSKAKFTIKVSK